MLCAALDAAGLRDLPRGARRRLAVSRRCSRPSGSTPARRERILTELVDGDFVGVEREVRALGARPDGAPSCCCACRTPGADPRCSRGSRGRCTTRRQRDARRPRAARPERRRADHLRPRAGAQPRLLHRRDVPGLRPRLRRPDRRAAAATTSCSGSSGGRCRRSASRSTSSGCTSRSPARSAGRAMSELRIAVPRGALFTETLDLLDRLGTGHPRGARERPQAAVRGRRHHHHAALRRADLRRGRRRRHRHHRQGRADGAVRARGLRARRPRLRALHDGAGDGRRRGPRRGGAAAAGRVRIATKYPRIATAHFLETRAARPRSSRSRGRSSWRR